MNRQWIVRIIGALIVLAFLMVLFSLQRSLERLAQERGVVEQPAR